jgi:hypothetical protein
VLVPVLEAKLTLLALDCLVLVLPGRTKKRTAADERSDDARK